MSIISLEITQADVRALKLQVAALQAQVAALTPIAATAAANTVFAGPATGSAAAPTFRALVAADLPLATTGAFGAVKPDGSTILITAGVIST